MLFDILLVPFDSYWHKRCQAMEREYRRAESNLRYSEGIREGQEADLAELSKKDWMQQKAIRAFGDEREKNRELVETLQRQLGEYQQRYIKAERENRALADKLEAARRNLAQEYDNRDELVEGIEEVSNQLREYKDLARRLQEDLDKRNQMVDNRDQMIADQMRQMDELRAQYEALTHEDGGEALAG